MTLNPQGFPMRAIFCALILSAAVAAAVAAAERGEMVVAAWDCGAFANGSIAPLKVGQPLQGEGSQVKVGERYFLHLAHGQSVAADLESGPLAQGRPVAIEVEFTAEALPDAYHGGLVEAGSYGTAGVRILFSGNMKISVEHFPGGEPVYLVSSDPIQLNKPTIVRYEHDGKRARLLINGKESAQAVCAPAGRWSGKLRIGVASGNSYNFNGTIGKVRVLALP